MDVGEQGYCGMRSNENGRLVSKGGTLDWYHDPLPTNCVADWVCAGGSYAGYPQYSYRQEAEFGYKNLAVFYRACSFNCLYCQNWYFKQTTGHSRILSEELATAADSRTSCICYFGGDPAPQIDHAIRTSELALASKRDRILRICWETNGSMGESELEPMVNLSLLSGGCLKFDLKAFTEEVNLALCGVSNESTLRNFEHAASFLKERRDPPLLIASTLLVPGYLDLKEVRSIAKFVARLDPDIPYVLLGFHPHFLMEDLPRTSRDHADRALAVAREEGLTRVRVGNAHLLSDSYGTGQ
jgi:pyruvate formate lyase activating enzyme